MLAIIVLLALLLILLFMGFLTIERNLRLIANNIMEANKTAHNRQSMQCCPDCGYPFGARGQCINGNCVRCK
jgi:uncharacterized paraquat-inducible protein A